MAKCKQAIALVGLLLAIPLPTRAAEAPQNLTVLEMPSAVPAISFTDAVGFAFNWSCIVPVLLSLLQARTGE